MSGKRKEACGDEEVKRPRHNEQADEDVGAKDQVYANVQEYYGKVLGTSNDLKTSACCTANSPHPILRKILKKIPEEIIVKYYGCGNPIPLGIQGLHVLDLGSGSGRDCYIASALVGPTGSVTGVDMTDEQLDVARRHVEVYCKETLGYSQPNMEFKKGYIEFLEEAGVAPNSKDLVISNCVVNLSPDKGRVLASVYKSLKFGGEFYFSDVYVDRKLPPEIRTHKVLHGECLGGALYLEDFYRLCHRVGFLDPRIVSRSPIDVRDPELVELVGNAKFESITFRLFKLEDLETKCEDYGQAVKYNGTVEGHPLEYPLDEHHTFVAHKWSLVCGNSASMVCESWLRQHFQLQGDRKRHFGLFPCGPAPPSLPAKPSSSCC